MNRIFLLTAIVACLAFAAAAQDSVQPVKTPDFSGAWTLDVHRSQLGERNNIESQTMKVTQSETEIKIETSTKRGAPAGIMPGGAAMGGRGKPSGTGTVSVRGGAFGGGDSPVTFSLAGKETTTEVAGPMGPMPVTLTAKVNGAKLHTVSSRTFNGPSGEVKMTTEETWEILTDGKTLRVDSLRTSPRGTESTVRIYTRDKK